MEANDVQLRASDQQTVDLFLKVSSFTRYLLSSVLPTEVTKRHAQPTNILGILVDECDALMISLETFKEAAKQSQLHDEKSSQLNDKPTSNDCEKYVQEFREFCEMIRNKNDSTCNTDIIESYYCKLCSFATLDKFKYKLHCSIKEHINRIDQTLETVVDYKCALCNISFIAPSSELEKLKSLPEHCELDKHFKNLKDTTNIISPNIINDVQLKRDSGSESSSNREDKTVISDCSLNADKLGEEIQTQRVNLIFKKVKKRILNSPSQLPDIIPHYCNICNFVVYSDSKFIEHSSSKEHITAVNTASEIINLYKCEKCGFLVAGFQGIVDELINSFDHKELDELMKKVKQCNPNTNQANVYDNVPLEAFEIEKEKKVEPSMQDIKKCLRDCLERSQNSAKHVPLSYCSLCNKCFPFKNEFQQHICSKKHKLALACLYENIYNLHTCKTCFLTIFGTDSDFHIALETSEHVELDNYLSSIETSQSNRSETVIEDGALGKNLVLNNQQHYPIPVAFFNFTWDLKIGSHNLFGFCSFCVMGLNITKGWEDHLLTKRHRKALKGLKSENRLATCNYCKFQLLIDENFNLYMKIHVRINHPDQKFIEIQSENLIEISKGELGVPSIPSGDEGDCKEFTLERNPYTTIHSSRPESQNEFFSKSSINTFGAQGLCDTPEDHNSKSNNKKLPEVRIFIEFLEKRKTAFLNEKRDKFGGMCLLCKEIFEDYFDWLLHLKLPNHQEALREKNVIERCCPNCNLSLFGTKIMIEKDLWFLEEHINLDMLFN